MCVHVNMYALALHTVQCDLTVLWCADVCASQFVITWNLFTRSFAAFAIDAGVVVAVAFIAIIAALFAYSFIKSQFTKAYHIYFIMNWAQAHTHAHTQVCKWVRPMHLHVCMSCCNKCCNRKIAKNKNNSNFMQHLSCAATTADALAGLSMGSVCRKINIFL